MKYIDLLSNIEDSISYTLADGTLFSGDQKINREINEILNLNVKILKDSRKQAVEAFQIALKKKFGSHNKWSQNKLRKEVARYEKRDVNSRFKQFNGLFIYLLNKKIRKLSSDK